MLNDTGLTAHLLGLNSEKLTHFPVLLGPLLESFVVNELRKQSTWQDFPTRLFHFRTEGGQKVDVVLENSNGDLVGIEVKASQTVSAHDFKGLHVLAELAVNDLSEELCFTRVIKSFLLVEIIMRYRFHFYGPHNFIQKTV